MLRQNYMVSSADGPYIPGTLAGRAEGTCPIARGMDDVVHHETAQDRDPRHGKKNSPLPLSVQF